MSDMERMDGLIPRTTPLVNITVGGIAIQLHYANTRLFRFKNGYSYMDHVFIQADNSTVPPRPTTMIFGERELEERLEAEDFPTAIEPYPCDFDVQHYENYQRRQLEKELAEPSEPSEE